jgi:O-antigen ligase
LLVGVIGVGWAVIRTAGMVVGEPHAGRRTYRPYGASISTLAILFLAVIGWGLFQAQSFAPADWAHPLWGMASEALNGDAGATAGRISLAPDETLTATMRLLSYGLVFVLAFTWGRDERRARRALQWLVAGGIAYAVYGLYNFWSGSQSFFWFESPAFSSNVHGTFLNRNHYANYTGLVLLCALALFYHRVVLQAGVAPPLQGRGRVPRGARVTTTSDRIEQFALLVWKPLLVILLLTTALILSHSRGGFLSTLAGGAVLLYALGRRRKLRSARARAAIVIAVAFAAIAFWLTSEVLLQRIDRQGLSDDLRFSAYELIRESSAENPLLGFGYGTFADSFRLYRSDDITGYLDRAHNTYLENIFELGWPAALLLFGVIGAAFVICIRGVRDRGKDWHYPALGIAVTVLTAIHAWVDFSLQMPAIAMTYAAIMGVAVAQSYSSRIT